MQIEGLTFYEREKKKRKDHLSVVDLIVLYTTI